MRSCCQMESKWRENLPRGGSHTYQKLSQCQGERFIFGKVELD